MNKKVISGDQQKLVMKINQVHKSIMDQISAGYFVGYDRLVLNERLWNQIVYSVLSIKTRKQYLQIIKTNLLELISYDQDEKLVYTIRHLLELVKEYENKYIPVN